MAVVYPLAPAPAPDPAVTAPSAVRAVRLHEAAGRPAGGLAGEVPAAAGTVRLPEAVYRRRRAAVAMFAAAAVTAVLALGRPDGVPPGEVSLWPSRGEVTLPAELPGVYVVQPGDTLWDIARTVAPGADPRTLVSELAEAAGGAALEPGQGIVIDTAATAMPALGPDGRPAQQNAVQVAGSDGASQRIAAGTAGSDR